MSEDKPLIIKSIEKLPEPTKNRLLDTCKEIDIISEKAIEVMKTSISGKISFVFEQSAPIDILTPFERAQSVCFTSRYEHLPVLTKIDVFESNGKYFLKNIGMIRHLINEYRSIIANQRDSIFYSKIHKFCRDKLLNYDPSIGLSIKVLSEKELDLTNVFLKALDERHKAIKIILDKCEFDYIYNGILQHSEHKWTKRFWHEYYSGEINHIFIKHACLLGQIKEFLFFHYKILNYLTFPKLGPI